MVSVSADGSTWFLGEGRGGDVRHVAAFQYPLMDRLGFWGGRSGEIDGVHLMFQYPLMDRLGFWGCRDSPAPYPPSSFSIR